MMLLLICTASLLLYAGLIFYYHKGWTAARVPPQGSATEATLSVIIPARNEEKNIAALLQALARQSLPGSLFEVIVVDDHSTDGTADAVRGYDGFPLRLLQAPAPAEQSSKKKAIETGVAAARGKLIVTTDADCLPGPHWLRAIHDFYTATNAAFIAAPVRFMHDRSLLQVFQALDFLVLQGITAASVNLKFHSMCNGANLAYERSAFLAVHGFEGIDHLASGDDMLLMHKIAKLAPHRVFYLRHRDAIVATPPMATWSSFFNQRRRWASKTLVYDDYRIIAVLAFVYWVNLLFVVLVFAALFHRQYAWATLGFWLAKALIELPFVSGVAAFYEERKLLRYFAWLQPLHIFYTVFVGFISQFGTYEWKGRRTK